MTWFEISVVGLGLIFFLLQHVTRLLEAILNQLASIETSIAITVSLITC